MALKVTDLPPKPDKAPVRDKKPGRTRRTYTVAQWLELPRERPYYELVDGVLQKMPSSTPNHGRISFNIRAALLAYMLQKKLGDVDGEVNVIIEGVTGRNGWIPDLVFALKESQVQIRSDWYGVPDWVLEVWAADQQKPKRITEKRHRWQQAGVKELWEVIVEKGKREVKVYRLNEQGVYQIVEQEGEKVCSEVIEGFCIERSAIFANLIEETLL